MGASSSSLRESLLRIFLIPLRAAFLASHDFFLSLVSEVRLVSVRAFFPSSAARSTPSCSRPRLRHSDPESNRTNDGPFEPKVCSSFLHAGLFGDFFLSEISEASPKFADRAPIS